MAQHGIGRKTPPSLTLGVAAIPDKLYFRIGEAAALCRVAPYVLRFWESEFPQLKPSKGESGQRLYRRRDVETALCIRKLLYEEGFTIAGARQALKAAQARPEPQMSLSIADTLVKSTDRKVLHHLRREMMDVLQVLATTPIHTRRSQPHPLRGARSARVQEAANVDMQSAGLFQ